MIDNPWINRAAVVVLLLAVYAVGYDHAKQQAAQQPVTHLELKP